MEPVGVFFKGQDRRYCHWGENLAAREGGTIEEEPVQSENEVRRKLLEAVSLERFRHFGVTCAAVVTVVLSFQHFLLEVSGN